MSNGDILAAWGCIGFLGWLRIIIAEPRMIDTPRPGFGYFMIFPAIIIGPCIWVMMFIERVLSK